MSNSGNNAGTRVLRIADQEIHDGTDCFVIAEIGHNHQGSVETCRQLFEAAKQSGVSAVKLQKRDNRSLYTKDYYDSPYNSENAYGPTYGTHREALEFGKSEYLDLKALADSLGLLFFATAFDFASVDFLEDIGVPCYKIASGDLTNTPLLRYIAGTGKPVIMSTGAATLDEVLRAHEAIAEIHSNLAILQCTATYPSDYPELNLRVLDTYRQRFPSTVVGYSGHDSGIAMALVAYMLGARVIEKHFTLNRAMRGTDHGFSLEPTGMRKMIRDLQRARLAQGSGEKTLSPAETSARKKMGKKIVAARPLAAGHVLQPGDLNFKSPGDGLPPYLADSFYGRELKGDLGEDCALTEDVLTVAAVNV